MNMRKAIIFLAIGLLLVVSVVLADNTTNSTNQTNSENNSINHTTNSTSQNNTQTNSSTNNTSTNTTNQTKERGLDIARDKTLLKRDSSKYAAFLKNSQNNDVRLELETSRNNNYFAIERNIPNPTSQDYDGDTYFVENKKEQIKVYPLTNGFEYEVTLLEEPTSNVISFKLDTSGYNFYYQPPLDEEYSDSSCSETECEGKYRPENVIYSYAVYEKNPTSGTGKVFHIYRPWAEDDSGTRVWGKLNVNTAKSTLEVILPESFLENANYPVLVDPTFGYTTAGASTEILFDDNCMFPGSTTYNRAGVALETNESAQIDNITAYIVDLGMPPCNTPATDVKLKYFLNEENASGTMNHTQLTYAEDTSYNISAGGAWHTIDITNTNFTVGGNIVISAAANASSSKYVGIAFDSGSGNSYDDNPSYGSYEPHENPWSSTNHGAHEYSIYASYTPVCIPSYTNTSWTNTANSSCQMNGYYESTWQATEYDIYSCPGSSNTTHTIYNETFTCSLPSSGSVIIGPGFVNSQYLYKISDYWGITNDYSFWLCKDSTCSTTCQADIRGGLIVACD